MKQHRQVPRLFTLASVPDYPADLEVDYPEKALRIGRCCCKRWLLGTAADNFLCWALEAIFCRRCASSTRCGWGCIGTIKPGHVRPSDGASSGGAIGWAVYVSLMRGRVPAVPNGSG